MVELVVVLLVLLRYVLRSLGPILVVVGRGRCWLRLVRGVLAGSFAKHATGGVDTVWRTGDVVVRYAKRLRSYPKANLE